jgi:hypothetical protein
MGGQVEVNVYATNQVVRNVLFTMIALCAGLLFALIAYALFAFPTITQPDSLQLSQPPGPLDGPGVDHLRLVYLALGLLVTGACAGAALAVRRPDGTPRWSAECGVVVGITAALIMGMVGVRGALLARSPDELQAGVNVGITVWGWTLLIAGVAGAVVTRRVEGTALALLWGWVAFALLSATIGLARDIVLADHLTHSAWVGDITCNTFTGNGLAGCEIGDDLGGRSDWLIFAPFPGASILGVLTIARVVRARWSANAVPGEIRAMVPHLLLATAMVPLLAIRGLQLQILMVPLVLGGLAVLGLLAALVGGLKPAPAP